MKVRNKLFINLNVTDLMPICICMLVNFTQKNVAVLICDRYSRCSVPHDCEFFCAKVGDIRFALKTLLQVPVPVNVNYCVIWPPAYMDRIP